MKESTVIATWFHADSDELKGVYSQTRGDSSSSRHYTIYFECIYVFFACLIRNNRQEKYKLFLNDKAFGLLPHNLKRQLQIWSVEILVLQNTHNFYGHEVMPWANQFFLLDIFKYQSSLNENFCLMDSDVITLNNKLLDSQLKAQLILYEISNADNEVINGLSVQKLNDLLCELVKNGTPDHIPYFGGEFVYVSKSAIAEFSQILEAYYSQNLERFQKNEDLYAKEEAHLISLTSSRFVVQNAPESLICRVWTQPWTQRDVPPHWRNFTFLHLPAEKKTGIHRLYSFAVESDSWFWTSSNIEWRHKVGRIMGLSRYGIRKFLSDLFLLRNGIARHLRNRIFGRVLSK